MKYRTRIYYSEKQKALIWDRWSKGESLHAIARLFDRSHGAIFNQLSPTGGIRPSPRKRSRLSLPLTEREEISRGVLKKELLVHLRSKRAIRRSKHASLKRAGRVRLPTRLPLVNDQPVPKTEPFLGIGRAI